MFAAGMAAVLASAGCDLFRPLPAQPPAAGETSPPATPPVPAGPDAGAPPEGAPAEAAGMQNDDTGIFIVDDGRLPEFSLPENPVTGRPRIVLAFDPVQATDTEELRQALKSYGRALREARYDEAIGLTAKIGELYPADPRRVRYLRAFALNLKGTYLFAIRGDPAGAVTAFEELDALGPPFWDYLKPWGVAAYQTGDHYSALKHLQGYIDRGGPGDGIEGMIGIVLHGRNEDREAARYLARHVEAHPEDSGARTVLARIETEQQITGGFTDRESAHFRVEFDGSENLAAAYQLLTVMERAYVEVGRIVGHTQGRKFSVVLFSGGRFRDLASRGFAPDWSGGFFDGYKIRVPSERALQISEETRNTLFHEYAHALIHDRAGAAGNRVPRWLHEGIAQMSEPRRSEETWASYRIPEGWQPFAIRAMEGVNWNSADPTTASLLYGQAFSLVKFLATSYPRRKLMDLVDAYASGKDTDAAFQSVYGFKSGALDLRWQQAVLREPGGKRR